MVINFIMLNYLNMKILNHSVNFLFIIFISLTVLLTPSCKKDVSGCTDPNAENYNPDADKDDGSCSFARDKFIGSYNVNENCDSGNWNYSISITESSSSFNAIVISNFGDYSVNVRAVVSGANITFNDTQSGITFSGSGNISGNTLTIIYTASSGGNTDNCTKTCIRQ